MDKWEYTWVYVPSNWKELKFSDGAKYKGIEGIFGYFNELGEMGWELVSAAPDNPGGKLFYGDWLFVFKRQKTQ